LRDPLKIYPNWDFGFEKIPSGNPVIKERERERERERRCDLAIFGQKLKQIALLVTNDGNMIGSNEF
jgi:hypothetical protein